MPEPEVTLLLPCLNEKLTLPGCLAEARQALATLGCPGEILVADNGSTDGSQQLAVEGGARVVPVEHRGYGHALAAGIAAARGRFVIMADADGSYDFREAPAMVAKLREGADIVMGNRFAGGILPGAMPWKNRYIGNPILSWIGRLFFGIPVRDFHCGIRGGTRTALQGLDLRTGGMEFASEMVIKAALAHLRMVETPATLRPDGRDRPPHLRPWRDGWRHLRFMLLFSPRWLFLYPGLVLFLLGATAMIALLTGPLTIGQVTLDVHTMQFAAASVLCGFQALAFAAISKIFIIETGLARVGSRLHALLERFTVERGLVTALLLAIAGSTLAFQAVRLWQRESFGDLVPAEMLRWVLPAVTALVLSAQVAVAGFFADLVRLRLRR